jgi:translation initiation factor IF-2
MAATRVYILARELGVKSSAIVNKCEAEGLDVKNHMSVISAGLAATIREWFSESENVTTVETTQKVDLKRVRIRKKTKKKKAVEEQEPKDAKQAEQEKTEEKKVEKIKKSEVKKKQEPDKPIQPEAEVEVAEPEPPKAPPKIVPPKEPEPIKPAGPILEKPAPARLTGPDVVRVEKPEPLRRPRPRRSEPVTEPLIYSKQDGDALQVPVGSDVVGPASRHKERTRGRRQDDKQVRAPKKFKFGRLRQRDIEERQARLDAAGGEGLRLRPTRRIAAKLRAGVAVSAKPTKVVVSEPITVKALSAALAVKTGEIISKLIQQNVMASANQIISSDVAELVALEFGRELQVERKERIEQQIRDEFERRERKNLKKKAVVATMLGHVDHGKTSLLDRIRSTHVTQGEAGGITQHIGAYQVSLNDSKVTFLDTPGHEAFTSMRARGANMTDVVVLVVAADDGIMPQTVEAIAHSKAAGVPVLVALNKIDLPGCDFNRIYSQLSEHDLTPIEWGGDTDVVKTSAVTGEGIDDLLEHLDYAAELLELKADDTVPATGWVVEARMSATRGPVATLLIKEGRLAKGAVVLAGAAYGRIKTLRNSRGKSVKVATSSTPVEITGLGDVPQAGDRFYCLDDINRAKAAAEENQVRSRESSLAERTQVTLDNLFSQIEAGKVKELNLIIRADVQGSVDVLTKYLSELSTDEVKLKILHATPGGITEGDVVLAEASNAIVIGFNVVADERVEQIAETGGVDIRLYNVIYRITDDLRKSMAGLLEPEEQEQTLGRAVVRKTFKVSKVGTIAGCYVNSGVVTNKAHVRLIRDNVVVRNALAVESLKHFKDDVREVKTGLECGVKFAKFDDVKEDDVLEFYTIIKVQRTL